MEFEIFNEHNSIIKVLGVGGGGCNAVNYMYQQGIPGVNFAVCNTDKQDLQKSPVPTKIQLGPNLLEGLGAGADPEEGRRAAFESEEEIRMYLSNNTKMVFVTAGMGGGTGTGGAPVVAKIAKDLGILTVGIVTLPFTNEGKPKREKAEKGLQNMKENVDALIVVSNNKLYEIYPDLDIDEAFSQADEILTTAAKGVTEIITKPGKINVDFNDVKRVMQNSGVAIIGIGQGSGENRAMMAIEQAMSSPLLEDADIYGARGVVLYINYGTGIKMRELDQITDMVQEHTQTDCELIWGVCKDESLGDEISITLIATGYQSGEVSRERQHRRQQTQNKVVHTLDLRQPQATVPPQQVVQPQAGTRPEPQRIAEEQPAANQEETMPVIESPLKVDASAVAFEISNEQSDASDEEVDFEIRIVEKPRVELIDEFFEEKKTKHAGMRPEKEEAPGQFSLFELNAVKEELHLAQDMMAEQELERDLIKKRISIEMQKQQISLHELEKEPAYKRYGYSLDEDHAPPSNQSSFSNYMIYSSSEDPGKIEIRQNPMKDITLD